MARTRRQAGRVGRDTGAAQPMNRNLVASSARRSRPRRERFSTRGRRSFERPRSGSRSTPFAKKLSSRPPGPTRRTRRPGGQRCCGRAPGGPMREASSRYNGRRRLRLRAVTSFGSTFTERYREFNPEREMKTARRGRLWKLSEVLRHNARPSLSIWSGSRRHGYRKGAPHGSAPTAASGRSVAARPSSGCVVDRHPLRDWHAAQQRHADRCARPRGCP